MPWDVFLPHGLVVCLIKKLEQEFQAQKRVGGKLVVVAVSFTIERQTQK